MNGQVGLSIALWTGCLSLGQAWVFRGKDFRVSKHLLVWTTASILMVGLGFALIGMQRDVSRVQAEVVQLAVIAGIINGLSLLVAGRWKGRASAAAASLTAGAGELAGIHAAFVIGGGGVALLAFGLLRLANANF